MLLVSHDLTLAAQLCDRLVLLAEGRIAGLGTAEAVLDPARLRRVYGCEVTVERMHARDHLHVQVVWPERR